jgi:hypothetical protein
MLSKLLLLRPLWLLLLYEVVLTLPKFHVSILVDALYEPPDLKVTRLMVRAELSLDAGGSVEDDAVCSSSCDREA